MRLGLKGAVGAVLSVFLIWLTLRGVDFNEVWAAVRDGNLWLLGASVLVATSGFLLRALRWHVLLRPVSPDTSLRSRFGATTIGFMANNLLPARMGEFVRAYALSRMEPVSMSGALGTLVVERLLDGFVLLLFLVLPILLPGFPAGSQVSGGTLGTIIQGMFLVLIAFVLFLAVLLIWPTRVVRVAERVLARFPGAFARRSVDALEAFLGALQVMRRPGLLLHALAWSLVFWSWHAWSFYLGMAAFGIHEGVLAAMFTEAVVGFGVALPSAPGFFGTFHFAADWALSDVYGVDSARSLAFAYGYHLGGFFPVTFIGLWYARRLGLSLSEMGRSEARVQADVEATHPEAAALLGQRAQRARTPVATVVEMDAPAKVNLMLRVLEREPSGYHRIETVFQSLELADRVRVELADDGEIRLEVTGMDVGPARENLVYRAARAFLEAAGSSSGLRIRLDKRIPAGAGLGGGSSDAASTLRALDVLVGGAVSPERLRAVASELGSDVPFFLSGSPLAVGWGRGERLEALAPLAPAPVIVALSAVHVSTAAAYQALDRRREPLGDRPERAALPAGLSGWDAVARIAENDFEAVILPAHPLVARARDALRASGPRFVLLSGSGSAVFALYRDEAEARAALARLEPEEGVRFVLTRTRAAAPRAEGTDCFASGAAAPGSPGLPGDERPSGVEAPPPPGIG